MTLPDYNLLAILPDILFLVAAAVQYLSSQNISSMEGAEGIRESIREQSLFTISLEATALAAINGVIYGSLSGSFAAGAALIVLGTFLGIISTSLLKNGYQDLSEYIMVSLALLFLYEFLYFLAAGSVASVFGAHLQGWVTALIWFFGLIGGAILSLFLYSFLMNRGSEE